MEQLGDLRERGARRVVVDDCGRGSVLGRDHERGEDCGDGVTIRAESARRTDVDAIGERLTHACSARTVLRHRGGPRGYATDTAVTAPRDLGYRASLAIDRRDEQSRGERRDGATPRLRPRGDARVLDDDLIAMRANHIGGDLPCVIAPGLRVGSSIRDLCSTPSVIPAR